MATTDLNLKDAGSLPQPVPIGRLVRLGFGALCLLYVAELWDIRNNPTVSGQISFVLWSGLPFGLYFLNYVVNIGFSQSWKKWPAALSALALVVMAFVSKGLMGEFDGPIQWNWHQRGWPNFTYDQSALQDFEEQFLLSSGGGLSCKLRG